MPCEDCLGKRFPFEGILHKCYRNDRSASVAVTAMAALHRTIGTFENLVDVYLAGVTEWAREKFVQAGIPAAKLILKPNFVFPDPGTGTGRGGYALFVGRLVEEKGVGTLLDAWTRIGGRIPLTILGDGPLAGDVTRAAASMPGVRLLGYRPLDEMYALLKEASFLVFPSQWYEAMPRTIVDAFAVGTPVVAANLGAMTSMISDGRTGLHFRPGDAAHLADRCLWMSEHPAELAVMRDQASQEYELRYTAERSYELLMDAYAMAIRARRQ